MINKPKSSTKKYRYHKQPLINPHCSHKQPLVSPQLIKYPQQQRQNSLSLNSSSKSIRVHQFPTKLHRSQQRSNFSLLKNSAHKNSGPLRQLQKTKYKQKLKVIDKSQEKSLCVRGDNSISHHQKISNISKQKAYRLVTISHSSIKQELAHKPMNRHSRNKDRELLPIEEKTQKFINSIFNEFSQFGLEIEVNQQHLQEGIRNRRYRERMREAGIRILSHTIRRYIKKVKLDTLEGIKNKN